MATYVAVFALILAYVALVAAYCALRTLAKLRRSTALLSRELQRSDGSRSPASLVEVVERTGETTDYLAEELADLRALVAGSMKEASANNGRPSADRSRPGRAADEAALGNLALVRYDAFGQMSGRMSFSLALLNEHGDGVTISALAGPTDTRVYAKSVAAGKGEQELSPEETQAVSAALDKRSRKPAGKGPESRTPGVRRSA